MTKDNTKALKSVHSRGENAHRWYIKSKKWWNLLLGWKVQVIM